MNRLTLQQAVTAAVFQKWFQWQFSSSCWPEWPKSSESLSQSGVCIVHCAHRFLKPMGFGPGEPGWL